MSVEASHSLIVQKPVKPKVINVSWKLDRFIRVDAFFYYLLEEKLSYEHHDSRPSLSWRHTWPIYTPPSGSSGKHQVGPVMSYNTMNTEFQEGCKRCLCVLSCRRKPCLILTDVLETEPGKAYMERIKRGRALGSRMLHSGRESGRSEKEPLVRRDVRCRWSESRNDESKSVAPKCNQSTTSSPLHR